MYIQTESTPNPNSLKFHLDQIINENEPITYLNINEVAQNSLEAKLFSLGDIVSIFYGLDFITITKKHEVNWDDIKLNILVTIEEHISAGFAITQAQAKIVEKDLSNFSEIEQKIIEIINNKIRPAVAADGGDIIFDSFKDSIVWLELHGACSGCPNAQMTLKNGIEAMLKYYIPEVEAVEAIENREYNHTIEDQESNNLEKDNV